MHVDLTGIEWAAPGQGFGLRIADFRLRIAQIPAGDFRRRLPTFGLRIADFRLRIAQTSAGDCSAQMRRSFRTRKSGRWLPRALLGAGMRCPVGTKTIWRSFSDFSQSVALGWVALPPLGQRRFGARFLISPRALLGQRRFGARFLIFDFSFLLSAFQFQLFSFSAFQLLPPSHAAALGRERRGPDLVVGFCWMNASAGWSFFALVGGLRRDFDEDRSRGALKALIDGWHAAKILMGPVGRLAANDASFVECN